MAEKNFCKLQVLIKLFLNYILMPLSLIFPINLLYIIFIAIVFVWSCPHLQLFYVFWYGFNIDSSLKIALYRN